jgi:hypothetical protein
MSDVQAETQEVTQAPAEGQQVEQQQTETRQQPDTSWVPKRISEITAARRAAEARAEQAEAELARMRTAASAQPAGDGQPPATQPNQSVDQLARAYAERMVSEQRAQDSMTTRIAEINAAGTKEFGEDFDKSVQNLNMAGIGGPDFLRVITNVPNPEKVVTWLGKSENLNEAMRLASMDPIQMGIEMTKLSTKAAKELGKQISKVPPPVQAIDGGGGGGDGGMPDPEKDPKGFIAWRNKNARKRR